MAGGVGTIDLTSNSYRLAAQRLAKGVTGTIYRTPEDAGTGIDLLLER